MIDPSPELTPPASASLSLPPLMRWYHTNSFTPAWLPARLRHPLTGYLLAALAALVVVGVVVTVPAFPYPGMLVLLSALLLTQSWGFGVGIFATCLGAVMLDLVLSPPHALWLIKDGGAAVRFGVLICAGIVSSAVVSRLEYARRQALASAEALRDAERKAAAQAGTLEAAVETIADAVLIFNSTGKIVRMNAAARALIPVSERPGTSAHLADEQLRGLEVCNERGEFLPEEQLPHRRVLAGETLHGANTIDLVLRRSDGQEIQVNVSGAAIREPSGEISGAVLGIRDVTERRRLERRSREALDALLDMAHALVHELSASLGVPSGTRALSQRLAELTRSVFGCRRVAIISVDPESSRVEPLGVVGLPREQEEHWWRDFAHAHVSDFMDPSVLAGLEHADAVVIEGSQLSDRAAPYAIHSLLVAPLHLIGSSCRVLMLDYGDVKHTYADEEIALAGGVARLATLVLDRQRLLQEGAQSHAAELALREANRRMDEFLGIASHELRTPLTSMQGFVELASQRLQYLAGDANTLVEDTLTAVAPVQRLLQRAGYQVERLNRLITDLLDATRVQAGRLEIRREPCDLVAVVRDVVQEHQMTAPDRSIEFALPSPQSVPLLADGDRLGQVVTNYLTNALRYAPADRPITVSVVVEGQQARVNVRDEGPGLHADEQELVWDRFYRVPTARDSNASRRGLGLGLYISRTIVEQHGGRAGVTSVPGAGSTFWFTVPLGVPAVGNGA